MPGGGEEPWRMLVNGGSSKQLAWIVQRVVSAEHLKVCNRLRCRSLNSFLRFGGEMPQYSLH